MKKAVFLVIHFVPHQEVTINTLIEKHNLKVCAYSFQEPHNSAINSPYLKTYNANDYSVDTLAQSIINYQPDFMVVAGWVRNQFVQAAKKVRKELAIPVIAFSDTQWNRTYRQCINTWISSFHLKKAYSHIWISGIYQYEYAKKLNFKNDKIIHNFLSCDLNRFNKIPIRDKTKDKIKKIVFIGRLVKEKGLDLLIKAWKQLNINGYELRIIGSGKFCKNTQGSSNITFTDFLDQEAIEKELQEAYAFILPSRFEPWGIVIHEAAAAGIPLLVSRQCGAQPYFCINDHNGYVLDSTLNSVKENLLKLTRLNSEKYLEMSNHSRTLSMRITPEIVSANLMSVLEHE